MQFLSELLVEGTSSVSIVTLKICALTLLSAAVTLEDGKRKPTDEFVEQATWPVSKGPSGVSSEEILAPMELKILVTTSVGLGLAS